MMYRPQLSFLVFVLLSSNTFVVASDCSEEDSSGSDFVQEIKQASRKKGFKSSQHAVVPVVQADTVSRMSTYLWCQMPGRKYRTIVEASIKPDSVLGEPLLSYAQADQSNYFSKAINECAKNQNEKVVKVGEDGDYLLRSRCMLLVAKTHNIEVMQTAKEAVYQSLKSIKKLYDSFLRELEEDPQIQLLHSELPVKVARRQARRTVLALPTLTSQTNAATGTTTATALNATSAFAAVSPLTTLVEQSSTQTSTIAATVTTTTTTGLSAASAVVASSLASLPHQQGSVLSTQALTATTTTSSAYSRVGTSHNTYASLSVPSKKEQKKKERGRKNHVQRSSSSDSEGRNKEFGT